MKPDGTRTIRREKGLGFNPFARAFGPMRVLGVRIFRVVVMPMIMVVAMSVPMVMMMVMRVGILHFQPAHARAERVA